MDKKIEDILIDANMLKNNNTQKRFLDEYVKDIIMKINTEIRQAQSDGNYYIITEVPIIFDIPNMKNSNAQRIIWARTIDILKNKHFDVKIDFNKDICRLKVSWLDKGQYDDIKRENQLLEDSICKF